MIRMKLFAAACLVSALTGLFGAGDALFERAQAQPYPYQCPVGYYWNPTYGCLPLSYLYGPPTYVYPDIGFGFFYGGRWSPRPGPHGGHPGAPHGGAPHGGATHGGAPHGGGSHH